MATSTAKMYMTHGYSSMYPITKREQMSFNRWSRGEPIVTNHTDHWSKLRCKSYKLTTLPTGNYVSFCHDKNSWQQRDARKRLGLPKSTVVTLGGTLAPLGSPDFNKYLVERLHNPHIVHPRPPTDSRGYGKTIRVPSAASQRAKLGQKYWIDGNRRATPGKKSTFGSKGTYLGIGVPRL